MKTLGRLAATLGLVAALSACVAPAAGGFEASPGEVGRAPAEKTAVTADPVGAVSGASDPVVTVSNTGDVLSVAIARFAKETHPVCVKAAYSSIMAPSDAQLADADRVGTAGVLEGGRVLGDEAAMVAAYEGGTVVARTSDGRHVSMLATIDGRPAVVAVLGFRTPAGNTLWIQVHQSVAVPCP